MSLNLGRFADLRHYFATRPGVNRVGAISGGRTSGVMDALMDDAALLSFQNTGKEVTRTYEFLDEIADATGREIVWLEYRPPTKKGGRPCEAGFAVVDSRTADRSGGPFEMLLYALESYRASKGKGPLAPWVRARICTSHLKLKVKRRWLESLGWTSWDECVGLRADEPDRVHKLGKYNTKKIVSIAPLADAGITKADVMEFWSMQSFDLGIEEYEGNCDGCFLKDQTDLSRALAKHGADWWIGMERRFPGFGGKNFAGYERLAAEAPMRLAIEEELRAGRVPQNDGSHDPKRFRLVVIQERKRIRGEVTPFSCSCEGAETMARLSDEEEDQLILDLPEAA